MKKVLIWAALMAFACQLHAKEDTTYSVGAPHAICLEWGGGLQTHLYDLNEATRKLDAGATVGIRYQFIPKHWGFVIGFQASHQKSHATLHLNYAQQSAHGDNNMEYTRYTQFNDWEETQSVLTLEMPILAQYRNTFSNKWGMQIGLGIYLATPIKGKYTTSGGNYVTTGYFESTNIEYEELINHGFLTESEGKSHAIENLKNHIGAMAEIGFIRAMGDHSAFYLGFYGQYGFTNNISPSGNYLIENGAYQGIFGSREVSKVHALKAGVKMGFQFGMKKTSNSQSDEKVASDTIQHEK